ncbi:hypothetical protein C0584_02715 [Candidatus Parcubacteria bacterium]|nr:MAG: hypothetical protein C0584_02715 [Candidatus Parcubacteria bacterium]
MQDIYTKILTSKKFWKIFIPVILFVLVGGGVFLFKNSPEEASAGWWNDSWNYRKTITINKDYVVSNETNFPVLVSLTDSDFVGKSQEDGGDFVFTSYSGDEILKHEIESYASSTGALVAWVKLPNISSTTDTYIQMYYGNASTLNREEPAKVWDDNYVMVQHMNSQSSTSPAVDSTSFSNDGSASAPLPYSGGKVGPALDFDGTDDVINVASSTSLDGLTKMTLSGWIYFDGYGENNSGRILHKENEGGDWLWFVNDYDEFLFSDYRREAQGQWYSPEGSITTGGWYYVVATFDNSSASNDPVFYINGLSTTTTESATPSGNLDSDAGHLNIGNQDALDRTFEGRLDEIRVSNNLRSASWVETEYNNQNSPSTFLTASVEEVGLGPVSYWSFDEGYGTTAHDNSSGGNDGTIAGATWQDESMCISGKCLYFDGSGDRVEIANFDPSHKGTINFWIKPIVDGSRQRIIGGHDAYESYIERTTNPPRAGQISNQFFAGAADILHSGDRLESNKWYYLSMSYNYVTNEQDLYINGRLKASSNLTANDDPGGPFTLSIGTRTGTTDYYTGYIDEVKIYPYARTADQIKQDYNAGLAGVKSTKGASAVFGSRSNSWMSDGLVGYWKLDETATTSGAIDSSGNGNNGTYYGNASTTGGRFGNGAIFNGAGDYILATGTEVNSELQELTISLWVKPAEDDTRIDLLSRHGGITPASNSGWGLYRDASTNKINWSCAEVGDWHSILSSSEVSSGSWTHITGVFSSSGNFQKLYVNGIEEASVDNANWDIYYSAANNLSIGRNADGTYNVKGKIDDVRIYNRALSPGEVEDLYQWAPGPVVHLKMDEKQGTTAYDSSGYGNNGTLSIDPEDLSHWTRGKYGGGLRFEGDYQDDSVNVGSADIFDNMGQMTVGFWVKEDQFNTFDTFVGKSYDSSNVFNGWAFQNGGVLAYERFRFHVDYSTTNLLVETPQNTVTPGEWQYLTLTWDGTADSDGAVIYINGIKSSNGGTDGVGSRVDDSTYNLGVGSLVTYSRELEGVIDDVKIYNYIRTQKQILEDMNGGRPAVESPVLYYKFDEGYGATVHDYSGNGYEATLVAGAAGNTSVVQMWSEDGKSKKAIDFDGVDDYLDTNQSLILDDFTINAWFKASTSLAYQAIVSKQETSGSTKNYYITLNDQGRLWADVSDGANTPYVISDSNYNDNDWHFVSFTRDTFKDKIFLYIDGEFLGSAVDTTTGAEKNAQEIWIGKSAYTTNHKEFDGLIDEVKIYNYSQSIDEIQNEYNMGLAALMGSSEKKQTKNDLVGHWKFDETATTSGAIDSSGYGNNATFYNEASLTAGKFGNSALTSGSIDFIRVGNVSELDFNSTDSFSAFAWVKGHSDSGTIFGKMHHTGGYKGYDIYTDAATWNVNIRNNYQTNAIDVNGTSDIIDDSWHHVGFTYDGSMQASGVKLYVDGIEDTGVVDYDNLTGGIDNYDSFTIGSRDDNGASQASYFQGQIDEVRVYNKVLSQKEITDLYEWAAPPILELKFDEKVGSTVYDTSGNGNDGNISGASWTRGKLGGALSFDGNNNYVDLGSSATIDDVFNGGGTLSAWIYAKGDGEVYGGRIVDKSFSTEGGGGWGFGFDDWDNSLNYFRFIRDFDGSSDGSWWSDTEISLNQWHHIVLTYNDDSISNDPILYIDGQVATVSEVSTPNGIAVSDSARDLFVGNYSTSRTWDGYLDDVKIYDYIRTPAQIAWDYNKGAPVAEWRFDECSGSIIHDESGNGNDGTITIGASGSQTTSGSCASSSSASAWYNGRDGKYNGSLNFDGIDDYVSVGDTSLNVSTISFWTKQDYPNNFFLDLDGGTNTITLSGGRVQTTGLYSPTIYIDGEEENFILDNIWHQVTIVTDTEIDVSNKNIGKVGSDYYEGQFDEIKLFSYPLILSQVKNIYNSGSVSLGYEAQAPGSLIISSLADGETCSDYKYCFGGACSNDWWTNNNICHSDDTQCVYNNGGSFEHYADGYEKCSGDEWYKVCSSGSWGSSTACDTTIDYQYSDGDQCGWKSQAADSCNSDADGGCVTPAWGSVNDCGEFYTTSNSSCNHNGELAYCEVNCGATCELGQTNDSGVDYCNGSNDLYNRIDVCGVSANDCLWSDNGATNDTLVQDCGDGTCNFYADQDSCVGSSCISCPSSCSVDGDCDANAHCDSTCLEDLANGEICNENSDCISNDCNSNICQGADGTSCSQNTDCLNNNCWSETCRTVACWHDTNTWDCYYGNYEDVFFDYGLQQWWCHGNGGDESVWCEEYDA